MATIFSNANGQVVEAKDDGGTYYYLADGLGTPTLGWWAKRDDAVKALENDAVGALVEDVAPACDGDIYEDGTRDTPSKPIAAGYVVTEGGLILVQVPDPDSHWGFYLVDDDQSWDGGFGIASSWELVKDDDPRITDEIREKLGPILEEAR